MHIPPNQKIKTLKRARGRERERKRKSERERERESVCVCVCICTAHRKRVDLRWQWSTKLSYRRHQSSYLEAGEVSKRTGWIGRKEQEETIFFSAKER